jgi:NAD/NADP transhydrogenase alpha subunit
MSPYWSRVAPVSQPHERTKIFAMAGAQVSNDRNALLEIADVLPVVNKPDTEVFQKLKSGATVIGFLRPLDEPKALQPALTALMGLDNFPILSVEH